MPDQKAFPGNLVHIKKGKWSGYLATLSSVDRRPRWVWVDGEYREHTFLSYRLAIPKVGYRRFSSGGFGYQEEAPE